MNAIALFVASLLSLNAPQENKTCHRNCAASDAGLQLVSHFEGFSPFVYKDIAGLETIGIGHLIRPGDKFKEPMLPEEAHDLLRKDMRVAENGINKSVSVRMSQFQADAVISFTYNLGAGALRGSTLLKKINAERHAEAAQQFLVWDKARSPLTGKLTPSRGLARRREAESTMYRGGV